MLISQKVGRAAVSQQSIGDFYANSSIRKCDRVFLCIHSCQVVLICVNHFCVLFCFFYWFLSLSFCCSCCCGFFSSQDTCWEKPVLLWACPTEKRTTCVHHPPYVWLLMLLRQLCEGEPGQMIRVLHHFKFSIMYIAPAHNYSCVPK